MDWNIKVFFLFLGIVTVLSITNYLFLCAMNQMMISCYFHSVGFNFGSTFRNKEDFKRDL